MRDDTVFIIVLSHPSRVAGLPLCRLRSGVEPIVKACSSDPLCPLGDSSVRSLIEEWYDHCCSGSPSKLAA